MNTIKVFSIISHSLARGKCNGVDNAQFLFLSFVFILGGGGSGGTKLHADSKWCSYATEVGTKQNNL